MVRPLKILFVLLAAFLLFSVSAPAWAESPGESSQTAGWTPQQANEWTVAQMKYAQAVKQYGKDSPEATQAQVLMNTLARDLGIQPTTDVPEEASMDISTDISTAPETNDKEPTVDRHGSKDQPASPNIDLDHPQPAPQVVEQAPQPVQMPDSGANTSAPVPAPAVADPPVEK